MRHLSAVVGLTLLLGITASAQAGTRKEYKKGKRQSTTQTAFQRAEIRLASLSPGMSQYRFMATVQMNILKRDGQPVDAWVDGYLGPAPAALLARPLVEGERSMLFGYEDESGQHPRVIVIFMGSSLSEIQLLDQPERVAGRRALFDSHTCSVGTPQANLLFRRSSTSRGTSPSTEPPSEAISLMSRLETYE